MSAASPAGDAGPAAVANTSRLVAQDDGTFLVNPDRAGGCFGCGQGNDRGLRLRFRLLGDGGVSSSVEVPAEFCGVEGVVHGGIQAAILDEVSGVAAQISLPEGSTAAPCVTAELALRFRRSVAQDGPVTAVARAVRREGRNIHVEASIVAADGTALTTATSRWVQLPG